MASPPPPPPSLPPPPKRMAGPPPAAPGATGAPPPPPSLPPPPPRAAPGAPPPPPSLPPPPPRAAPGAPPSASPPAATGAPPPPSLPPPPPRPVAGAPPPPSLPPPPPRPAAGAPPPPSLPPPPPPAAPGPPPASKAPATGAVSTPPPAPAPKSSMASAASPSSTAPPSAASSAPPSVPPSVPASPASKAPAAPPPKVPSSASALPIRGDSAPPPTGTFERPALRSVSKAPQAAPAAAVAPPAPQRDIVPQPIDPKPSSVPVPSVSTAQASAPSFSSPKIPSPAATVTSRNQPLANPPSAPQVGPTLDRVGASVWQQAWGLYAETAADERSELSQLLQSERAMRQTILHAQRDFTRKVDELLLSEASSRSHLDQLEETERISVLGVPFVMGREIIVGAAAAQRHPSPSGPSRDDVLATLQQELEQLRAAANEERSMQMSKDEQRAAQWSVQSSSMSQKMQQLEEHVRQALTAYQSLSHSSVSEASARAAEQAMERLQEAQLSKSAGNTISDDARRLAKVEFAKMRADARDTALRHAVREERDARDFLEEMQFLVRREVLHLFQAGVLKPLHRISDSAPPPEQAARAPSVVFSERSPSSSPLHDVLRREATDLRRCRRFVQYFHLIGFDSETSALYSARFMEHGFGFAVDLCVPDAESVLAIHQVCRDVTPEELAAMGIASIGERRTLFSRIKQFDQQQAAIARDSVSRSAADEDVQRHQHRSASGDIQPLTYTDPQAYGTSLSPSPRRVGHAEEHAADAVNFHADPNIGNGVSPLGPERGRLTSQAVQAYREKCLVRLGQLDRQLSDAWTAARHAARRRRTYSYAEETDWDAALAAAQEHDAARISAWLAQLSGVEVACKAGAALTLSDLPAPFDNKAGTSRGALLERRVSGRSLPRLFNRSDSMCSSRGTSGGLRSTTPAFPSWW